MLGVKHCLGKWRHIVEGSEIYVRTDHQSLKGFRTQKNMTKRLTRFIDEIEHFDPIFIYKPGRFHTVPDALSRMPGTREEGDPADTPILYLNVEDEDGGKEEDIPELVAVEEEDGDPGE